MAERRELRHHATSEYDFTHEEVRFGMAMDRFKRDTGKLYPTWTDVLRVIKGLGYRLPSKEAGEGFLEPEEGGHWLGSREESGEFFAVRDALS